MGHLCVFFGEMSVLLFIFWIRWFIFLLLSYMHQQSCPTLYNPMDCSPPGSSVHGIPRQEYWSGFPFPITGESSQPRDRIRVSCIAGGFFTIRSCRYSLYILEIKPLSVLLFANIFYHSLFFLCLQNLLSLIWSPFVYIALGDWPAHFLPFISIPLQHS